jgi:tetratricopeptide (TPR) repeat protein
MRTHPLSILWLILVFVTCVINCCSAAEAQTRPSPWDHYNEAVQAYANRDYPAAFERWQDLSLQKLPPKLQRQVWFQLGNVQFHMGEPLEQKAPEAAAELWRRSCDAYQTVLAERPRDSQARHNLELVQRRLAVLLHRVGMEAFHASGGKSVDDTIELLSTSHEQLQEASSLSPTDPEIARDYQLISRTLRERLKHRAETAETKADESARETNSWAEQRAEEQYRAALEDLGEARLFGAPPQAKPGISSEAHDDSLAQSIAQAGTRVQQKLSQLLTRRGKRAQREGDENAENNADQALGNYETALEHYRAAREVEPGNLEAANGEREVRSAMEKVLVSQGHIDLERGKKALAQESPNAAPALSSALNNYETALQLKSLNGEAKAGADEARRLLPEALVLAGKTDLTAGDRAEKFSVTEALSRYQEAEKNFQRSLDMETNQPAEQGLREAKNRMERVRGRVEAEAEAAANAGQPQNKPPRTLQSLLGQVEEKERTPEFDRQRQQGQRSTRPRSYHEDW